MWNDSAGFTVLEIVPDGTDGAVPIRLANERNQWYAGMDTEIDEEAEYTGLTEAIGSGQVRGTRAAFLNEAQLTLAHELGHAIGLFHPFPTATSERYVPANEQRVGRAIDAGDPRGWRVAPVGLMGNQMRPNSPDFRGLGPSPG